jgi:LysR family glycine cleavage system transcriptional activator
LTFDGLQTAVAEIVGSGRQTLRLAVCSSFGPGWLIGRLDDFLLTSPSVDLQLKLYSEDPELTDQVADAFVTALPLQPGFSGVHVLDEMLVAIHAPRHANAGPPGRHRLITTDVDAGNLGRDWLDYSAHSGLALDDIQQGPWLQCTHYMLAYEMAKAGLGVALVPDFLVRRDLASGVLARFDKSLLPSGRRYHLCYKQSRAQERGIQDLVLWFKTQLQTPPVAKLRRIGAK